MKAVSGKRFCRLLEQNGWELRRVNGSHHIYGKSDRREILTIPVHGNQPLKLGLQRALMKMAPISENEL